MSGKRKIIRAATVPTSLETFLDGAFGSLMERYDLVLLSSPGVELDRMGAAHGATERCGGVAPPDYGVCQRAATHGSLHDS